MISVCVPVYNVNVSSLAGQLSDQAEMLDVPVEIIFLDDCSDEATRIANRKITDFRGVVYRERDKNSGRAAIRNELGKMATYPWLLFLDADSVPAEADFLRIYTEVTPVADVICGGTVYSDYPPPDKKCMLRWIYGRKREQLPPSRRTARNRFAINSNNFMIRKEIFLQYPFRESIRGYGHEDTVLGFDLSRAGIEVMHIGNPVFHTGLEPSEEYLEKTKAAIDNLVSITGQIIPDIDFQDESDLLSIRNRLRKNNLLPLAGRLFRTFQPFLEKNLTGRQPRLLLFDLYRIGYLCSISGK